jgi:hypothetical protein
MSGKGVWMVSITLVETSLSSISYGWLWAGIFFLFILLVALSSIFGYLEVSIPAYGYLVVIIPPSIATLRPVFLLLWLPSIFVYLEYPLSLATLR